MSGKGGIYNPRQPHQTLQELKPEGKGSSGTGRTKSRESGFHVEGSATAATPPAETTQPQIPSSAQVDRGPELTTNSVVAAVVFVGRGRHRLDSLVCEQ